MTTSKINSQLVSFKPSGIGSVVRTLDSKLRESVSVMDFIDTALHSSIAIGTYMGDLSAQIMVADAIAVIAGKKLFFPSGTYYCNVTLTGYFNWFGEGQIKTVLRAYSSAYPVIKNLYKEPNWRFTSISNIGFHSYGPSDGVTMVGVGFSYGDPAGYTTDQELVGRVVFNQCLFIGFDKGVFKCFGNIGNTYNQCSFQFNNYGVYARDAQTAAPISTPMQADTDTFNGGEFHENAIAALCYLTQGLPSGQLCLNSTVIQVNKGFGVFMDMPNCGSTTTESFNCVWFEANGYTATPVLIDTLVAGVITPTSLMPVDVLIRGIYSFNVFGLPGGFNGIGTAFPNAPLGIWGNQRTALNIIAGGYAGAKWSRISFSDVTTEASPGAYIQCTTTTGISKDMLFVTGGGSANPLYLSDGLGSVKIGSDAYSYAPVPDGAHAIYGAGSIGAGDTILTVGTRFSIGTEFGASDSTQGNSSGTVFRLGKVANTGRSINAGGTINASGADYAEYEFNNGLTIQKGDIVGFDKNGKLTLTFSDSIRFGIKSTNPSYVGGDTWASEDLIGTRPIIPSKDSAKELIALYDAELTIYTEKLNKARLLVDRVAYSGKVPCNVKNAIPGGYIIAVNVSGIIKGEFVLNPTFEQYKNAVGRVNKLISTNQCEVAVIIH